MDRLVLKDHGIAVRAQPGHRPDATWATRTYPSPCLARSGTLRLRLRGLHCGPLDESPLGCFFMYLLYLDDAGSPGNAAEEYFVLGGVCVYEAQVDWFSREIDKLATTRETSLQKLSREFRKAGTRWGSLKNIADTPFFVDSRASRLADCRPRRLFGLPPVQFRRCPVP